MATAQVRMDGLTKHADIGLALLIVGIMTVMVIPLPAFVLDVLLAFSITISMVILLVVIYIKSPLQFAVFPSLLLITTLYRLSLNVATTRLVLLHGNEGTDAAGKVIEAFGLFVVGGNYVVGAVVFTILVIINFKVITQGATRISEVAARFTLDAMPGKQMSIDADLNAGLITETDARTRRKALEDEATFYGSMDGALKFVRGDAVAGIMIVIVNIVAGFSIGVLQQGMRMADAASVYMILTIGDGLVAQLPTLLISTASGLIVTRTAGSANLGKDLVDQLFVSPRAMGISSAFLLFMAIVPGMPTVAFMALGTGAGGLAYLLSQAEDEAIATEKQEAEKTASAPPQEKVEALLPLDTLELEIGYELIPLVDQAQNGELLERIKSLRRQFALEMGIIVPPMHIRDNLQLKSNEYSILIKGVEVARGDLWMNHHLAIDPGTGVAKIPGVETRDPTFGLPALWVSDANKERARMSGYTVVDTATVITTHIKEIIRRHSSQLMGRQETQSLIDTFKETNPKVVEELIPLQLTLGQTQKVLQNLLREEVSIRDLHTILETLADWTTVTKDTDILTEYVRSAMSRQICKSLKSADGSLYVMTLDPQTEEVVARAIKGTDHGSYLALDPKAAQKIIEALKANTGKFDTIGATPVLLTGPAARMHIRRMMERHIPNLTVLSHGEVAMDVKLQNLAVVKI
jgi:flagellar biosynthesis protein FlhA